MTQTAVAALRRLSDDVCRLIETAPTQVWGQPSGCPGWSNQDMLIHLSATFRDLATPGWLGVGVPGSIERSNDLGVLMFRGQPLAESFEDYRALIEPALIAAAALQEAPGAERSVDLDDAGVYPAHLMADSLVFDHYCHLRHDLSYPRGQLSAP